MGEAKAVGEPKRSSGMRWLPATRAARIRLGVLVGLLLAIPMSFLYFVSMPGSSHQGELPVLTNAQKEAAARMRTDVEVLAGEVVARVVSHPKLLAKAELHIAQRWQSMGYEVELQPYVVGLAKSEVHNLEVEVSGTSSPDSIVIVGAHYDSAWGYPGADDNASGVAMLLELSRRFKDAPGARTLRLVAFVNEEPPYFQTKEMGSLVHARACAERGDDVVAMFSLETVGIYPRDAGSQHYPFPLGAFYGDVGDFIGFVGGVRSRSLVRHSVEVFREHVAFPSEGVAAPMAVPGIGWSDHWSYEQVGYRALMITDTAPFRNEHYHGLGDVPELLDYEAMARVTDGVELVIRDRLNSEP